LEPNDLEVSSKNKAAVDIKVQRSVEKN